VVAARGLGGFTSGLELKRYLLELEKRGNRRISNAEYRISK